MTSSPTNGFQAVDQLFECLPKTVSWTDAETKRLNALFNRGKDIQLDEGIVDMVYKMNKPFEENDDEIDNMLNWEAYRVEFQSTNATYLALKKKEADLQKDMLSFMSENYLCFSFAIMEMKRRLVEPYEVFHTYSTEKEVVGRIDELTGILVGENSGKTENQTNLKRNFYGAG